MTHTPHPYATKPRYTRVVWWCLRLLFALLAIAAGASFVFMLFVRMDAIPATLAAICAIVASAYAYDPNLVRRYYHDAKD